MRYDAEHKQKTRERVLAEAAKALRAEGPHRIGVAEVMAKAGLTHGGFYAHFSSKDELITAAIGQALSEGRARLARETGGKSPAEALVGYVDFYLSAQHRDARTVGCAIPSLGGDLPRLPEASQAEFAGGVRRLTGALAEVIGELGRPDPDSLAASVVAELVGALMLARAEPDRVHSDILLATSRRAILGRLGLEQHA